MFLIQITKSTGHRSCALSYHLNGASRMSRARKRSFEGKYLGKKVYAELSEGIGSTTEDPRISGNPKPQTKDVELFVLRAFPH